MYFNESNNTNIDKELKKDKKHKTQSKSEKKSKPSSERVKLFENFRLSPDTLLMFFYGFLLIVGIILIIISTR